VVIEKQKEKKQKMESNENCQIKKMGHTFFLDQSTKSKKIFFPLSANKLNLTNMAHLKTPKHITLRGHDFILSDVAADGSCMYRSVAVCMFHSVGINSDSFVRAGLGRSIDDDNF
jgi:hypothetical protein